MGCVLVSSTVMRPCSRGAKGGLLSAAQYDFSIDMHGYPTDLCMHLLWNKAVVIVVPIYIVHPLLMIMNESCCWH